MKCIYKIVCRDKEITEFYIGSSVDFNTRKWNHKCNSNNLNRKEYCYPLYMFINVNGGYNNWEFEVIKEYKFITKEELNINEQYYIELLKPKLNACNSYGLDKTKDNNYRKYNNKINNKKKANCPQCRKEMLKRSIYKHIKTQHPT